MSQNQKWTDVMVDLETTGTEPNRNSIIQVAAVKFNLQTRDVNPETFNRCLRMSPARSWNEDTRAWWRKQGDTLTSIVSRSEDPLTVMRDFADFNMNEGGLRFWAKPATFDYPFVTSYLTDYSQPNPFNFREVKDMNSFLSGLYFPNEIDREDEPKLVGVAHDALYDTLHQIRVLFHHVDRMRGMDAEFKVVS